VLADHPVRPLQLRRKPLSVFGRRSHAVTRFSSCLVSHLAGMIDKVCNHFDLQSGVVRSREPR
jgi:hypothetical protein